MEENTQNNKQEEISLDHEKEKAQAIDLIEMGKFYFLNQKYDQAIKEFKRSLKLNPESSDCYYNLGLAYEAKNMFQEAKNMYTKAVDINGGCKLAREHLDKLVGS